VEYSVTGVSQMVLTECVHSDGVIPPGRKYFSRMFLMHNRASVKRMVWLAEGLKEVATKTGSIICPSAVIS